MTCQDRAVLIHYPSGGFGHFIYSLLAICSNEFHAQDTDIKFSDTGDSHSIKLNAKTWYHMDSDYQFTVESWANSDEHRHIVLVDSGINSDRYQDIRNYFPTNQIIRMCIDSDALPIVNQTCLYKAQRKFEFEFNSSLNWDQREEITLSYWHALEHPDYYLNNFKPVSDKNVLNIPISWVVFQIDSVIDLLDDFLCLNIQRAKVHELHNKFMLHNEKYTLGVSLWQKISNALDHNTDIELPENVSLHDQGYINFMLEFTYQLEEIPVWDYRNWFRSTGEIAQAIKQIKSQTP